MKTPPWVRTALLSTFLPGAAAGSTYVAAKATLEAEVASLRRDIEREHTERLSLAVKTEKQADALGELRAELAAVKANTDTILLLLRGGLTPP